MLLLFALAVSFHADFEGGSLGPVDGVDAGHYRCHVKGQADQDGRNRQANWYYFRVDGAKDRALTLDMVDLPGEYNYQPNRGAITKDTLPFYSEDGKRWRELDTVEYDPSTPLLRLHVKPASNQIWIAHVPPYTNGDLARLLREMKGSPYMRVESAGRTLQGREIPLLTITDTSVPDRDKKVIWLMFRQHAWEAGSSWSGEGAIRFLMSSDATAREIRRTAVFKVFPMSDPDSVARGTVRFNGNGFDLNRNWDVDDPKKMPEIAAERGAILRWIDAGHRLDLFLTLHNTETSEYLDGPPGPLTDRLFRLLSAGKSFDSTRLPQFDDRKPAPGRATAPQALYRERHVAAFLIEQRIAKHPKLGHEPGVEDRKLFGRELVEALWRAE